jgi:hypothetical protein
MLLTRYLRLTTKPTTQRVAGCGERLAKFSSSFFVNMIVLS